MERLRSQGSDDRPEEAGHTRTTGRGIHSHRQRLNGLINGIGDFIDGDEGDAFGGLASALARKRRPQQIMVFFLLLILPEQAALDDADLAVVARTAANSLAMDGARNTIDLLDVRVGEVVLDA